VYTLTAAHRAAALVFKQLHQLEVAPEEFIPFGGQGEGRFLGGVAAKYSVAGYQPEQAKQQFFANYLASIADPNVQIAYPGGLGWGGVWIYCLGFSLVAFQFAWSGQRN
jgi:hypothetical protein